MYLVLDFIKSEKSFFYPVLTHKKQLPGFQKGEHKYSIRIQFLLSHFPTELDHILYLTQQLLLSSRKQASMACITCTYTHQKVSSLSNKSVFPIGEYWSISSTTFIHNFAIYGIEPKILIIRLIALLFASFKLQVCVFNYTKWQFYNTLKDLKDKQVYHPLQP